VAVSKNYGTHIYGCLTRVAFDFLSCGDGCDYAVICRDESRVDDGGLGCLFYPVGTTRRATKGNTRC
jgi:hypothetical protein